MCIGGVLALGKVGRLRDEKVDLVSLFISSKYIPFRREMN